MVSAAKAEEGESIMVDLEKKAPPALVSLAKSARVVLEKRGMSTHVAAVGLCLDISGSMQNLFSGGVVQGLIERVMGLGLNFDDNGAIDIFAFGVGAHDLGEFKAESFKDAAGRVIQKTGFEPGTRYAPAIRTILGHYGFKTGMLAGLFGSKKAEPRDQPVYMLFVTDGENSDHEEAKKAIIDASKFPIFFQFVGIGGGQFSFLRELDTMDGRFIDNANFFEVSDPTAVPEGQLYDQMVTEYPSWVDKAKEKNLLRR